MTEPVPETCVACEGRPSGENVPCAVCGRGQLDDEQVREIGRTCVRTPEEHRQYTLGIEHGITAERARIRDQVEVRRELFTPPDTEQFRSGYDAALQDVLRMLRQGEQGSTGREA